MKKIKKNIAIISIISSIVAAFLNYMTIKSMYYGYIAFMDKIYGSSGYSFSEIKTATLIIAAVSVALTLSFVYLAVMFLKEKISKRQIVEASVLTALLLAANILYFHFIPPTKLMIAISEGKPVTEIERLAKKSLNINTIREGYSALTLAAVSGSDTKTIKILVENGADINETIPDHDTPASILFLSAISNSSAGNEETAKINLETVKTLIDNGMDVNVETYMGDTALTSSFGTSADVKIIKMLIDAGADVNRQEINQISGEKGVTVLMVAAFNESEPEITNLLVESGADVNATTGSGVTVLITASQYDKNIELIKAIIKEGADINAKTKKGTTALMVAVKNNKGIEIIKALLENGADANIRDNNGKKALDFLEENSKMDKETKQEVSKLL